MCIAAGVVACLEAEGTVGREGAKVIAGFGARFGGCLGARETFGQKGAKVVDGFGAGIVCGW